MDGSLRQFDGPTMIQWPAGLLEMISRYLILAILLLASLGLAYPIESIRVAGDSGAEIQLQAPQAPDVLPIPNIQGAAVDYFLPGASLHESFHGKLQLKAPHALLKEFKATAEKKGVLLHLELNGASEGIKERLQFRRDGQGYRLALSFPTNATAAMQLAKDEQLPVLTSGANPTVRAPGFGWKQWLAVFFVIIAAGAFTFIWVKLLSGRARLGGSKKYLIESLAQCPIGPKASVNLIRVGREFMLIGVTPAQITLLSALPALQSQYEEETKFERDTFKDTVDEEIERLKKEIAL